MRTGLSGIEMYPSFNILKMAVKKTAEKRGGSFSNIMTGTEGRAVSYHLAMSIPDTRSTIGIKIRPDGKVSFVYDIDSISETLVREIEAEITQHYTVIAVIYALKDLKYKVETEEAGEKLITVKGEI
jgi:hypothetical protein